MDFNEEEPNVADIYCFTLLGTVVYSLLVFLLTYIYLVKEEYNEHYQYYFDIKEYGDCYIKNISYSTDTKMNEIKIKLYSTVSSINLTDYITDNIDTITEYTYFYKSDNYTYLSSIINKTIKEYLFQNITCYSDNKRIYLTNDNDYEKQKLFVCQFFIGYFSISLFLCCMIFILLNVIKLYKTIENTENNNDNINIVYINNNGNNN
jgi:hypothetical protein